MKTCKGINAKSAMKWSGSSEQSSSHFPQQEVTKSIDTPVDRAPVHHKFHAPKFFQVCPKS